MTNPLEQAPAPGTTRITPPPSPARRGAGCLGRLLSALLVIVITTVVALAVGAWGLLQLGFTPSTPAALETARARAAALETSQALQATEVAALARRLNNESETLGDLQAEVAALRELRAELQAEMAAGVQQNATLVAEACASRDQVAAFATAEAGRAALLAEIERRSARVERFLQRLSDISGDAALDLGDGTPTAPTLAPATSTPSLAPVTPTPTAESLASATPTTTDGTTATIEPTAEPTAELTATARATATSVPTATARATATPSQP